MTERCGYRHCPYRTKRTSSLAVFPVVVTHPATQVAGRAGELPRLEGKLLVTGQPCSGLRRPDPAGGGEGSGGSLAGLVEGCGGGTRRGGAGQCGADGERLGSQRTISTYRFWRRLSYHMAVPGVWMICVATCPAPGVNVASGGDVA